MPVLRRLFAYILRLIGQLRLNPRRHDRQQERDPNRACTMEVLHFGDSLKALSHQLRAHLPEP